VLEVVEVRLRHNHKDLLDQILTYPELGLQQALLHQGILMQTQLLLLAAD
jgi:hypothetical protein